LGIEYTEGSGMAHDREELEEEFATRCFRNFSPEQEGRIKKTKEVSWVHKPPKADKNIYQRKLRSGEVVDVYDVLDAFEISNPSIQHALKKMLCAGIRGYKDYQKDIQEAIDSLERAKSFPPE
jgi:hypothetical protein